MWCIMILAGQWGAKGTLTAFVGPLWETKLDPACHRPIRPIWIFVCLTRIKCLSSSGSDKTKDTHLLLRISSQSRLIRPLCFVHLAPETPGLHVFKSLCASWLQRGRIYLLFHLFEQHEAGPGVLCLWTESRNQRHLCSGMTVSASLLSVFVFVYIKNYISISCHHLSWVCCNTKICDPHLSWLNVSSLKSRYR